MEGSSDAKEKIGHDNEPEVLLECYSFFFPILIVDALYYAYSASFWNIDFRHPKEKKHG